MAHTDSGYATSVLGPTLLIAVGIGLTFPTLMAAATADAPESDAGIIGGLANTSSQIGGSVGLAVLATAASARAGMEAGEGSSAALAAGYDLVFLMAAGLSLAIAMVSVLLPHARAAARRGPTGLPRPSERAARNPWPDQKERDDHDYRRKRSARASRCGCSSVRITVTYLDNLQPGGGVRCNVDDADAPGGAVRQGQFQ